MTYEHNSGLISELDTLIRREHIWFRLYDFYSDLLAILILCTGFIVAIVLLIDRGANYQIVAALAVIVPGLCLTFAKGHNTDERGRWHRRRYDFFAKCRRRLLYEGVGPHAISEEVTQFIETDAPFPRKAPDELGDLIGKASSQIEQLRTRIDNIEAELIQRKQSRTVAPAGDVPTEVADS